MGARNFAGAVVILCVGCALSGCPKGVTREELSARCREAVFVSTSSIALTGFTLEQVSDIEVVEEREGRRVGSYKVQGRPISMAYGEDRFTAALSQPLRTDSSYLFILQGEPTHRLSQLRVALAPHFSMMSEGWGCDLESYVLDGLEYRDKSPNIIRFNGSKSR